MARAIEWGDNGNIVIDKPTKAVVRFPTQEEQDKGIFEVPRSVRIKENRGN